MVTQSWLNLADFRTIIGGIPNTYETVASPDTSDSKLHLELDPITCRVINDWLTDLIGEDSVSILDSKGPTDRPYNSLVSNGWDDNTKAWLKLIIPFLVHATWSEYVLTANVTFTIVGPVTLLRDGSDPITDGQRNSISRLHKGYADSYALKISKLAASLQCGARVGSGRPSVRSAGGKRGSRFDSSCTQPSRRPAITQATLLPIADAVTNLSQQVAANTTALSNKMATILASNYDDAVTKTNLLPTDVGAVVTVIADDSPGNAGTGPNGGNPTTFYLFNHSTGLVQQVMYPV